MKRILSIVLAIVMIVTLIPAYAVSDARQQIAEQASAAAGESEPQTLAASTEETSAAPQSAAVLSASSTVVTYAVTGGNLYFDTSTGTITDCDTSVKNAEIPSEINGAAVTSIGDRAFSWCTSLTSVTIPDSVTSMYLLVPDKNDSVLKIDDKSTTVKQTLEDILFYEKLKPFEQSIDDSLKDVVKWDEKTGYQRRWELLFHYRRKQVYIRMQ